MSDPASDVIHGGRTLTVRHLVGASEEVRVRLLPVAELGTFLSLLEKEEALAEFLCVRPAGWAATLAPDSLMDICEEGSDANFSNACRWAERRVKIGEAALPLLRKAEKVAPAAASAPSAPKSG